MIIGLTGSIGSGKSTAAKLFAKKGFRLIDADKVAHDVIERASVKGILVKNFGKSIIVNGRIDRKKLGSIVFSSRKQLKKLDSIMHPIIAKEIKNKIKQYKSKNKDAKIIIDAPLLLESKMDAIVDRIIVVVAGEKEIMKRSTKFSNVEISKRFMLQMPMEDKVTHADYVIDNTFGHDKLERQVDSIIYKLRMK